MVNFLKQISGVFIVVWSIDVEVFPDLYIPRSVIETQVGNAETKIAVWWEQCYAFTPNFRLYLLKCQKEWLVYRRLLVISKKSSDDV